MKQEGRRLSRKGLVLSTGYDFLENFCDCLGVSFSAYNEFSIEVRTETERPMDE